MALAYSYGDAWFMPSNFDLAKHDGRTLYLTVFSFSGRINIHESLLVEAASNAPQTQLYRSCCGWS